jgi:hypothetical protein
MKPGTGSIAQKKLTALVGGFDPKITRWLKPSMDERKVQPFRPNACPERNFRSAACFVLTPRNDEHG